MADEPQHPQGGQTDTQEHTCTKCGKVIKPGEGFTHQGTVYCCEKCCKKTDTPAGVCEFC